MTELEKRKASLHMKQTMANKDFRYSIYNLWLENEDKTQGDVINWIVLRQEMIRYFGHTKGDTSMNKEEANHVARWGKRYKNKRDRERRQKLD
tara:strand:- start:66 stop:344 length:279 start_codon:yes stop_codon:yes gene_type:complete